MTKTVRYGLLVAGVFAAACFAGGLFDNVPVIDDWAYMWSVEQMHDTGQFRILDYSCRYNVLQVAWAAAFCAPRGCSFVAARFSTVALAVVGLLALYTALARRTAMPGLAACATVTLGLNPVFLVLALSFMTDVPLIALVALAFFSFAYGTPNGRQRTAAIAVAVALGVAAYLVRELAIAIPIAVLLAAFAAARDRRARVRLLAIAAIAAVGLGIELWWIGRVQGVSEGLAIRAEGVRHVLEVPLLVYLRSLTHLCLTAAAFVAPMALATWRRSETRPLSITAAACAAAAVALRAVPFGANEVLSPLGLGMSRVLMPGAVSIGAAGQTLRAIVLGVASLSLAVILHELVSCVRGAWRRLSPLDWVWLLFGAGELALLMLLWLWQDRYYLIVTLPTLWLLALRAQRLGWRPAIAGVGCALFAIIAVAGVRDNFGLNRAAWEAEAWLRGRGIPAAAIDGGYILNGWRLYAHADRFAPGFPRERVPFLYSKETLPYAVSTAVPPGGEVLRRWGWGRSWLEPAVLYAVRLPVNE